MIKEFKHEVTGWEFFYKSADDSIRLFKKNLLRNWFINLAFKLPTNWVMGGEGDGQSLELAKRGYNIEHIGVCNELWDFSSEGCNKVDLDVWIARDLSMLHYAFDSIKSSAMA